MALPERLLIIEKDSGLTLFDHKWVESDVDEDFFGGVLQGLLHISLEAFRKGAIQEIIFAEGRLLIHHGEDILAGLIVSDQSDVLRTKLGEFATMFENDYYADPESIPNEVSHYSIVSTLISEYFPEDSPRVNSDNNLLEI